MLLTPLFYIDFIIMAMRIVEKIHNLFTYVLSKIKVSSMSVLEIVQSYIFGFPIAYELPVGVCLRRDILRSIAAYML